MTVKHKAKMTGYHRDVWDDKKAITNILSLSNVIKQYRVTYGSDDRVFGYHIVIGTKRASNSFNDNVTDLKSAKACFWSQIFITCAGDGKVAEYHRLHYAKTEEVVRDGQTCLAPQSNGSHFV
jgi:hypothetical protein